MKKHILKLYESSLPLANTNNLWVDIDENKGDIKAIHKYKDGEWNPYLVSVDYLKGDAPENPPASESDYLIVPSSKVDFYAKKNFVGDGDLYFVLKGFNDSNIIANSTNINTGASSTINANEFNETDLIYHNLLSHLDKKYTLKYCVCCIPYLGNDNIYMPYNVSIITEAKWNSIKGDYNYVTRSDVNCLFVFEKTIAVPEIPGIGSGDEWD